MTAQRFGGHLGTCDALFGAPACTCDKEAASREARLPKWARDQLATLRRELANVTRHRDALLLENAPENATAVLDPHTRPVGLGSDPRVRFIMSPDPRDFIDVRAVSTHRTDGLGQVHALELHGATGLVIAPKVTNHLLVGLRA